MYDTQAFEKLLGTPSSDTPLTPEFPTKKVMVHYWRDYDKGDHLFTEVETSPDYSVLDLMHEMKEKINKKLEDKKDISNYVIRTANKEGKPKIDMPILETSQKVHSLGFVRFVLCESDLDIRARKNLEELTYMTDENLETKSETEVKVKSFWKRCFCCE
jgi:hypothetical protein